MLGVVATLMLPVLLLLLPSLLLVLLIETQLAVWVHKTKSLRDFPKTVIGRERGQEGGGEVIYRYQYVCIYV